MKKRICFIALKPFGLHINGADLGNAALLKRLHQDGFDIKLAIPLDPSSPQAQRYENFLKSLQKNAALSKNPLSYLLNHSCVYLLKETIIPPDPMNYAYVPLQSYWQLFKVTQKLLKCLKPDIVLVSDIFTAFILMNFHIKPLLYIHNNDMVPSKDMPPLMMNTEQIKKTLKESSVLTVSHFSAKRLRDFWSIKSLILPTFVDPDLCVAKSLKRKKYIGLTCYSPQKGGAIFYALAKRLTHYSFLTWKAWHPSHQEMLESFFLSSSLPNLKIAPSTHDSAQLYSQLNLLLVPSLFEEAMGRALVEGGLNGLPIIATKVGGIPEVLGNAGIQIAPSLGFLEALNKGMKAGDYFLSVKLHSSIIDSFEVAIKKLLSDKAYYNQISLECVEAAQKYLIYTEKCYRQFRAYLIDKS